MFDYEEKIDNEELKIILKEEKKNLIDVTHKCFWNSLFVEAYKKLELTHRNPSGKSGLHYLVREKIDQFLCDLCKEYDLEITKQNKSTGTEFILKVNRLNEDYFSDSVMIFIGFGGIELRMISGLFEETFSLEEYEKLEELISEVCYQLYQNGKLSELLYEHLRIEESTANLTVKTVEIAQTSIRAIYQGRAKSFCYLEQKYLYSELYFQGKKIRVLHKEFLEMPEELMKELEKIQI